MKTAQDIILKPVITENSMAGIADKKYTFKVAVDATKIDIANAVETLFPGTKVEKVNTMNVHGRFRRQGFVVEGCRFGHPLAHGREGFADAGIEAFEQR